MPRGLIKIKDRFFEWSTIVDAPVTYGMSLDELKEYIKNEYGNSGMRELEERLKRVENYGTSFVGETIDSVIAYNRAGKNEKRLSKKQIYEHYTNND